MWVGLCIPRPTATAAAVVVLDPTASRALFPRGQPSRCLINSGGGFLLAVAGRMRMAGRGLLVLFFSAAVMAGLTSAANGPFLSDSVFQLSAGSTGRSLLQAKNSCPVNFEFQNYTIITSKCKGPKFPASECCAALKEFACPYYNYLNDESNDCASTMFSYINLYGKYPPGLFSSECKEGKLGLSCADVPQRDSATANSGHHAQSSLLALITVLSVVVALFH